jgi:hypothetical protein
MIDVFRVRMRESFKAKKILKEKFAAQHYLKMRKW